MHIHSSNYSTSEHVIVVLWFLRCMGIVPREGYNPYALENHSTADLYYDATNQTVGSVFPTTSTMLFYAAGVYELSRVHGFCTSSFSFEVWLHYSTSADIAFLLEHMTICTSFVSTDKGGMRRVKMFQLFFAQNATFLPFQAITISMP